MKNILIPVDGSIHSNKAVAKGKELAEAFDSNVILLNVLPPLSSNASFGYTVMPFDMIQKEYAESVKNSEIILSTAKSSFGGRMSKVTTVSLHGDPADTIISYIKTNPFDLVVMGSHGQGAIVTHLLTGSVTTKVLHHIEVPLLIVK